MKKIYLIFLLNILWFSQAGAKVAEVPGESCLNALTAVTGSNSLAASSPNYYVWYTYTMQQAGKLTISSAAENYLVVLSDNCNYYNYLMDGNGGLSVAGLEAGQTLHIQWETSGTEVSWNLAEGANAAGDLCSSAIAASLGENTNILPSAEEESHYWYSFTMPSEGKLVVNSPANNNIRIFTGSCTSLSYQSDGQGQTAATGITAGTTVYLRWTRGTEALNWSLAVMDYEPGDDCSHQATAVAGTNSNTVPALGNGLSYYYYTYTMPQDGKLIINSDTNLNLMVTDEINCELPYYYLASAHGDASVPGLTTGQIVTIRWEKGQSSFNWSLSVADNEPGDICSIAINATEGTNNTPHAPYWFSFTMPRTGHLTISSVGTATNDTYLKIYEACDGGSVFVNDDINGTLQSEVTIENVAAGKIYYIKWDNNFSSAGFAWNISIEGNTTAGTNCAEAVPATEGAAMVPATASTAYWYSFTMPFTGNLSLSNTENHAMTIYTGSCAALSVAGSGTGSLEVQNITEGTPLLISTGTSPAASYQLLIDAYLDQTITFPAIATQQFSAGSVNLSATASSGLAVTYEVISGGATVSGNTLTFTSGGSVTIAAKQPGNDQYRPAAAVEQTFCVNPAKPVITMTTSAGVKLTSDSRTGNQWYKEGVIISGEVNTTFNPSEPGNYSVQVTIDGCSSVVSDVMTVIKQEQTISFVMNDLSQEAGSATLKGSAGSGLPLTYEVTSGNATVSGNTLSFTSAGAVTITATQAGDALYYAAPAVARTFCINPAMPVITYDGDVAGINTILNSSSAEGNQWYKDGIIIPEAVNSTYQIPETGTYTLKVTTGGCVSPFSLAVEHKRNQTVSFTNVSDQVFSTGSITLTATASSELPVTFEVLSGGATVSGNILTFTAAGQVRMVAKQAGDAVTFPATSDEISFCVLPDKPEVTVENGGTATKGVTLNSGSTEGNQWYLNGTAIAGAVNSSLVAEEEGNYAVAVSADGCTGEMSSPVVITGLGDMLQAQALKVYPNPAGNMVQVEFSSKRPTEEIFVSLIGMEGKTVPAAAGLTSKNGNKVAEINLSLLPEGIYLILINDGDKLTKAKVMKK